MVDRALCPNPNKTAYPDEASAAAAMTALKHEPKVKEAWRLNVYLCKCGAWHYGHRKASLEQKLKVLKNSRHAARRRDTKRKARRR